MANLQVKNVPDDVYDELRRRAAEAGMTVRDYVLRLLRRDQAMPSPEEWLRKLHSHEPVDTGQSAADGIAEDRAEREAHLDRVAAEAEERWAAIRAARVDAEVDAHGGH